MLSSRKVQFSVFFFQAEDGIRDIGVTGVQTCALPISMFATAQEQLDNSVLSLIWYLIGFITFAAGFRYAVMMRANKDYKTLKAAVKPARTTFWAAFRALVAAAFWMVLVLLILLWWVVRDVQGDTDNRPPSPDQPVVCFSAACRS